MEENKFNNKLKAEEKEIIIDLFKKGYNTVYIANKIKRNSCTIQRFLKRQGYEIKTNRLNVTKDEEAKICELYEIGYTTEQIANIFKNKIRSGNTIAKILRKHNILIRPSKKLQTIEHEDFFEKIDSEEKAYLLGLFITDGCVREDSRGNRSKLIGITLNKDDLYMVELVRELLGAKTRKLYFNRNEVLFECSSNKMAKDLSQYGVVPRKTFKTYIPDIDNKYFKHLLRGIFDGDGIVSDNKNAFYYGICGTEALVEQFKSFCVNTLNIKNNKVTFNHTNGIYYWSFSSKKDIYTFYDYIYKDATIYLKRKKEKFENYYSKNIAKFEAVLK